MKVGLFDSGVGGITVLHEALEMLPDEDYIYYADTRNVPYGNRQRAEVRDFIVEAVEFIMSQGVKAVVIACNTATSVAIDELRKRYRLPIIGMEPAVKPAVEANENNNKRVLVLATALTLKEEKLRNLIGRVDNEGIVDLLALPGLVRFAESFEFEEKKVLPYLEKELSAFDLKAFGTVVLGCTHFPLYRDMFRKLLPGDVDIIDGSRGTVRNLKGILEKEGQLGGGHGEVVYFCSGERVEDPELLARYEGLLLRMKSI